ncbi:uncharacterized protein JCM10292_006570 [Rhodotorula paludigena]|uniref:uncharacterized protein n=1 Tax=Rhodotorula paludigena TaxID=86838 RepID=UPI00317687D7
MSSLAHETANPYGCKWRFCTETFPSSAELRAHVVRHVDEAQPVRGHAAGAAGPAGTQAGEGQDEPHRPEPHGEQSFPLLKEGAVIQPPPAEHAHHH